MSAISIREASIGPERAALVDALHRFLTPYLVPEQNEARFTWLYESNPHGVPRVWTAHEPGGRIIGVGAAFPRRLWAGDREEQGWVLGDFCIHPDHRSLGPAVRLQRVFLEEAQAGRLRFWYDFPSPRMVAVYRRMGIAPTHETIRFAKPLRLEAKLVPIVRSRLLASLLAAPANWILRLASAPPDGHHEMALLEGPCGAEFTDLFAEVRDGLGLAADRSAEYLNWRFRGHPLHSHSFVTARDRGILRAYAVLEHATSGTTMVDLVGSEERGAHAALLGEGIRLARAAGHATLSIPLVSTHSWVPLLQRLGFRARESSPVMAGGSAESVCLAHLGANGNWHLTYGDRDGGG